MPLIDLKRTVMKKFNILAVIGLLFITVFSAGTHAQTRTHEPLPRLLPMREQQSVREAWLKKRLDAMLLPMMRQQKIDMWIVTNEEFHADPITEHIAPPLPYVGRRDFFIFADRGGDKLDRLALVRYPEEHLKYFFEILNPPGRDIATTLRKIVAERNPKTIALNMGGTRGATTGLTLDTYKFLGEALGQDYSSRFVSAAPLIIEYMDTRLVHSAMNCSNEPRIHLVIVNLDQTGPKSGKLEEHTVKPIPLGGI